MTWFAHRINLEPYYQLMKNRNRPMPQTKKGFKSNDLKPFYLYPRILFV